MLSFLLSDDVRRDPYPWYEHMREASPVLCDPASGVCMLFDYASVKRAMDDPDTFSSRAAPPGGKPFDWLVFSDPPRHTMLRAIIMRAFTPRSIELLEPRIRTLSANLLDGLVDAGAMDLVADFATPLPTLVIAEMLGIPLDDRPRFTEWSEAIVNLSYSIPGGEEGARAQREFGIARGEIAAYLADTLDDRRSSPREDLLSRLVAGEVDGRHLTDDEIVGFFILLLSAATETTTNLVSNAMLCLMEHPDQRARLAHSLSLLPAAIEEVVRYRSPAQIIFRCATREVTMHGQVIPEGRLVLAVVGSANRDASQFPDPDTFDIARAPARHIGFGHGIHTCLGAALARLETRVAIGDLLARCPEMRLASRNPWEPRRALHVLGPSRLPVLFDAVSSRGRSSRSAAAG